MKAKALAKCQVAEPTKANRRWCEDLKLMAFLHSVLPFRAVSVLGFAFT